MLTSLNVDAEAFDGDNRSDRKTIIYEPFNYLNTLTMKNLPSLRQLNLASKNFRFIGSVVLENIPSLRGNGITIGDRCFYFVYSLQSANASDFDSAIRRESRFGK